MVRKPSHAYPNVSQSYQQKSRYDYITEIESRYDWSSVFSHVIMP